jgi:hypothetical protein
MEIEDNMQENNCYIKWRNILFFCLCICMPFLFIPKYLQLRFIGGQAGTGLIVYPMVISYIFTLYWQYKTNAVFVNKKIFAKFCWIYFIVLFTSIAFGVWNYPYYDLILNGQGNQFEKLGSIMKIINLHNSDINTTFKVGSVLMAFSLRMLLSDLVYAFGFSYIVYCWFKNDWMTAINILIKSIYIVCGIIFIYSFIEVFYLLNYKWAMQILIAINPFLHAIKENFGWWPPLLSPGRIRSIFPEPSWFGMYGAFVMPFLWLSILNDKKNKFNYTIIAVLTAFLYLAESKTTMGLLIAEFMLFFVWILARKNRLFIKKAIYILGIFLLTFGICVFSSIGNNKGNLANNNKKVAVNNNHNIEESAMQKYFERNIAGTFDEKAGSNSSRYSLIKSDIFIGKEHWLLGVGLNLKNAYNTEYFLKNGIINSEIGSCVKDQKEKGILNSGYPAPCEYSKRFAETGLFGLLLFFIPLLVLASFFRKKTKYFGEKEQNVIMCTYISLIGTLLAGFSSLLIVIYTYWLLLGICFAMVFGKARSNRL